MLKVCFLTSSNSRLAGGLFYTMQELLKQLERKKINVSLLSYDDEFSEKDRVSYGEVELIKYHTIRWPLLKSLGFSFDIQEKLEDLAPMIVHQQGIWMFFSYANLKYCEKSSSVIKIIEPHGMLDFWAVKNSAWKKKIVGWLYEYRNLETADCIHALCKSEYESIRTFGLKNPVAIIPNGVSLPVNPIYKRNHKRKILLFISRLHPKKGLMEFVEALATMKKRNSIFFEKWQVRIAGWGNAKYVYELQEKVHLANLQDSVAFVGSVYGKDKERELCKANAFILPSFSEGLPMAVLEAWAYRLPVLMTDYCNIPDGFERECAIRIHPAVKEICNGLEKLAMLSDEDLEKKGEAGYRLVKEKFTWERIAEQTLSLYDYLLGKSPKPDFVYEL